MGKEKLLVVSNFSFSHNVFKSCPWLMHQNEYLWSNGLNTAVIRGDRPFVRGILVRILRNFVFLLCIFFIHYFVTSFVCKIFHNETALSEQQLNFCLHSRSVTVQTSPINKSLRTLFLIWTFFLYAGSYRVLHRFL